MFDMLRIPVIVLAALWCVLALADEPHPGASAFIERMASEQGLDRAMVTEILGQARYQQSIIDAITRPAEGKPWHEYRKLFLTPARIAGGVEFWRANAELLEAVSERFGVPVEIIIAIVGVETNYGLNTGSYRVIDALATLGFYYPRRSSFFSAELGELLHLAKEEGLPITEVRGSYAGAMGVGQFIPSSYRAYAVDMDGDGRRDLWRSLPDALGSVANYLARHGWRADEGIVWPVAAVPEGMEADRQFKPSRALADLTAAGVQFEVIGLGEDHQVSLIELEQQDGPEYWLGLNNFYVITRYNRSPLYAMAVVQLAEAIAEQRQ